MCLPELSDDDSDDYEVCCGGLHSYVASVFFCVIDFWFMFAMFFLNAWFHYDDDSLRWPVTVPLAVLYIAFIVYLSGPVGLYTGHSTLIALYYYRVVIMLLFAIAWMIINFRERKTVSDIVLSVLWFLMALTYFVGWYVNRTTHKFFRTRWFGYDDGDLVFAAKLRAQELPVAVYNMREYFASVNLEQSAKELSKAKQVPTAETGGEQ